MRTDMSHPFRRIAWPRAERSLALLGIGSRRLFPQPALGIVFGALACYELILAWRGGRPPGTALTLHDLGLALLLGTGIVWAKLYPIHVARGVKVSAVTIPLYVLAALVAPPLAATAAGIAVLIGELAQRRVKGQYPSDIAATIGRWVILVLIGGLIAHASLPVPAPVTVAGMSLPLGAPLAQLPLVLAGIAMYCGDALTVALEIAAITGQAPHRVVRSVVRDGGVAEGLLYLVGLIGALSARDDAWAIVLLVVPTIMVRRLFKHRLELHDETRSLLESMADAVDLRDAYTGSHSRRVTAYTAAILRALNISGPEVALITAAARVHDIGKIAIPDGILNKPDRLSDEELALMQMHPQRGADFLARYGDFRRGISIVLYHHERIDGRGYPHGLRDDDIPFGARVIAVADSFDAMTSDRPYRGRMSHAAAAQVLAEGRGTQWDAAIVDAFVGRVLPHLNDQDCPAARVGDTRSGVA